MLVKIFSIIFNSALGGFDDTELREFLKDKDVISIQDHFFMKNEVPYLALVIKYFPFRQELDANLAPQGKRDEAWRETLSERSKEEGVPPYILFTNKQLAQLIKENPTSPAHLERVDGIGKNRVEKYGRDVLNILASKAKSPDGTDSAQGAPTDAQ
jgi:ATP-dependent DNA helicase RecQ